MTSRKEIEHAISVVTMKLKRQLYERFPDEVCHVIEDKLSTIIRSLNFNTHQRSIVIFVSSAFEKVMYLDTLVELQVFVDNRFHIRELLYDKETDHQYLLVVLSSKKYAVYISENGSLNKIVSHAPEIVNDTPEPVGNFADLSDRKEKLLFKFLRFVDGTIDVLLRAYQLPLFFVSTEKTFGYFKKVTSHADSIWGHIHGNFENANTAELLKLMPPQLEKWEKLEAKMVAKHLEEVFSKNKLIRGVSEVWKAVTTGNVKALFVEKDFTCSVQDLEAADTMSSSLPVLTGFNDVIDLVVEKVLERGGSVKIVNGSLPAFCNHVAIVPYF